MMSCCPPSAWGALPTEADYDPKGYETLICQGDLNLPIYYSKAKNESNKVIIFFTDVYGFNNRLKFICDKFADNDYHVIMPDCLRGETKTENPDVAQWLKKYHIQVVRDDINACVEYVKQSNNIVETEKLSIGSIGFCWGGWVIAKSASEGMNWKCAVSPHPSCKIESMVFGNDEETMFGKVKMPFLLLPAGDDKENLKPGSAIVEQLKTHGGESILFERMRHGWVSRGDLNQSHVKEDTEKALQHSFDFFKKHL